MEIVLAFAREHDVTRWEATRMLVCKGAGVEYVRPRKGRCPNGQRRASVAPKRSNFAKMRSRPVYANVDDLAARLPEKLRTKNRIRKLRSLVENGMGREEALAACSVDRRGQHMTSVWAARHEAGGMTRAEAIRNAQARSCETRHAAMLERFEAVVPDAFRARYAGREHEVMKRWRKAARKSSAR